MDKLEKTVVINKASLVDGRYSISDLINIDELRGLCEDFTQATGFTIGFLDHPGLNILISTGWRDICTKWHRGCPTSKANCVKSNQHLLNNLDTPGQLVIEKCENGLIDCAFPIIVKGKHIASLATGQLLLEKPDIEQFKRQAKLFGFDEKEYLHSLDEVPIVSKEKLLGVTAFLGKMALLLSKLGYAHITIKEEAENLKQEIATRKQLVMEREVAEAANQAKSNFLSNMSHEIRTPMNAILGFTQILKELNMDTKIAHYIETINRSGQTLLNLINDILDLSKIEAGKLSLQYEAISVYTLFEEMKTVFYMKMANKGLAFNVEVDGSVPDALVLDGTRLRQILINILGNSIKFTNSGHICLTGSGSECDDKCHSRVDLIIEVEDTGIGIAKDQQMKIFASFEQAKGQSISEYGGTGLGLAITRQLVEMMNGRIDVESELGKGSKFRIIFSDVEVAAVETLSIKKEIVFKAYEFEPATILVADDIDYNRELLSTFLEYWDFKVIQAENGKVALEQARQEMPDLVLLDMKMPEMDGYEAIKLFKDDPELRNIPVIAVTAYALKQDEEIFSKLSDGYLRKPINRGDLVNEMIKYLPHKVNEIKEALHMKETPPAEIVFPHQDKTDRLIKAAKMGNITDVKNLIKEIKELGPKYQPFIEKIQKFINLYLFDETVAFLEKHKSTQESEPED